MSSCRNALEELVIEEAEAQYKRLGADVKKRVDLSEVIAYTLNRLPPMYATTQRGWVQQRKKASQELGAAIAKTVRNGFLSTQSDVLRQGDPIPDHELISQARSLFKLRKLFSKDYLKWKDVPEIVRDALNSGFYQSLANGTYVSLDRRNSLLARSYAVRRKTMTTLPNSSKTPKTEKDISYATSRRGLQNLRQKVKSEMASQIISIVKEALTKVVQAPERSLSPLPFEKFNIELEDSLVQLRELLKRDDITWRNIAEVVEECLRSPRAD